MVGSKLAGVAPPVMSFAISSSVYPTARRAATLAIGKPVAFDARAEERETRGFISITTMRPVAGSTANCTFEPPVSTPISRRHAIEASRMIWYSLSVSVSAGANAHRIDVLDRADDDAVVVLVANDLHLVLFPAEHRLLDQHFGSRRGFQTSLHDLEELVAIVGNATTGAAQREGRADDRRQADEFEGFRRFLAIVHDLA